jgi:hypothetical protein
MCSKWSVTNEMVSESTQVMLRFLRDGFSVAKFMAKMGFAPPSVAPNPVVQFISFSSISISFSIAAGAPVMGAILSKEIC